jgi:hypothetical protein
MCFGQLNRKLSDAQPHIRNAKAKAYHEAGHAIMGYRCGYKVKEISILNQPFTYFDYGADDLFVHRIRHRTPNNLRIEQPNIILDKAKKYCDELVSGFYAEYFANDGHPSSFDIPFQKQFASDYQRIIFINKVVQRLVHNQENFIEDSKRRVTAFYRIQSNVELVQHLADYLLGQPNFTLTQEDFSNFLKDEYLV